MASYKCKNCIYYGEEYAPYIHATIPVCNYRGDYKCDYVRKGNDMKGKSNEPKNS